MPESDVTVAVAAEFKKFVNDNRGKYIPNYLVVGKYGNAILDAIMNDLVDKPQCAQAFLEELWTPDKARFLLNIFSGKEDVLCKIYINALDGNIDYEGHLFWAIYDIRSEIWIHYIDWLKEKYYCSCVSNIIENMWERPEYAERMRDALEILIGGHCFYNNELMKEFFSKGGADCNEKKKNWLLEQLRICGNDVIMAAVLIRIVSICFPEWEEEYILEFLKMDKSINDFKKLSFFPMKSWVGSEIPVIDGEISFLEGLKSKIKGLEYLEHKRYLEEYIEEREKHKEETEIHEYLEDAW